MSKIRIVARPKSLRRMSLMLAAAGICTRGACAAAQSLVTGVDTTHASALARQDAPRSSSPATRSGGTSVDPDQPYTPLYTPTAPFTELDDIFDPKTPTVDVGRFESPLEFALAKTNELEAKTGLRVGLAYTMIFQQASGGSGVRDGGSGDLDLKFCLGADRPGNAGCGPLHFYGRGAVQDRLRPCECGRAWCGSAHQHHRRVQRPWHRHSGCVLVAIPLRQPLPRHRRTDGHLRLRRRISPASAMRRWSSCSIGGSSRGLPSFPSAAS